MTRPLARLASFALAAFCAVAPQPGAAERTASLTARLTLLDPSSGRSLDAVESRTPFRIQVELTDATTGRAPRGLFLSGWIRPAAAGTPSCEQAARAFRATRAIPLDAVDLNGVLLAMLSTDGSLGVIDPKLNLRSSNMLAAATLPTPPDAIVADAATMRAYLIDRDAASVQAMSLYSGELAAFGERLSRPMDAVPAGDGRVWFLDAAGAAVRLDHDGHESARLALPPGTERLIAAPETALPATTPLLAAFGAAGQIAWFDAFDARTAEAIDLGFDPLDATFLGRDALMLLRPNATAEIRYLDDPERALPVPLGFAATRIKASEGGRIAMAYTPGGPGFALIDTATAAVVQPGALTGATIDDVTFTARAAFLLSLDGGFVGLIDLASVDFGKSATLRRVDLGHKSAPAQPDAALLVPLWPSPQVLAVDPETGTGWLVHEVAATGEMPPMDSVRLRGGVPLAVRAVDRSFRESAPGRFETMASLPNGGAHELVLTTGIGGFTACLPVTATGPTNRIARRPFTLAAEPEARVLRAGRDETLTLTVRDEQGRQLPLETLEVLVPSLQSSWSARVTARAEDGALKATLRFPHGGSFAIQPLGIPPQWQLRSAIVLEVQS